MSEPIVRDEVTGFEARANSADEQHTAPLTREERDAAARDGADRWDDFKAEEGWPKTVGERESFLAGWAYCARLRDVNASRPGLSEEQARVMAEQAMASPMSGDWVEQIADMILRASRGEVPKEVRVAAPDLPGQIKSLKDHLRIANTRMETADGLLRRIVEGWDSIGHDSLDGDIIAEVRAHLDLPEIQSPITDAAIDVAVAQARSNDVALCAACGKKPVEICDLCLDCEDRQHKAGATWDAAGLEKVRAEVTADPLTGLPEEERHRIRRAGIAARFRTYRDSGETQHDLATRNERDAIAREVAAYRVRQGVPETLTREEAEKRLRAHGYDDPDDAAVLLERARTEMHANPSEGVRNILRAYVRGLDVQGAAA